MAMLVLTPGKEQDRPEHSILSRNLGRVQTMPWYEPTLAQEIALERPTSLARTLSIQLFPSV